jgi:hypothetical protein
LITRIIFGEEYRSLHVVIGLKFVLREGCTSDWTKALSCYTRFRTST